MTDAMRMTRFNPRLREGGDSNDVIVFTKTDVSIHASAREATSSFHV